MAAPHELVRLRRGGDGEVAIGPGPGRGAWLCGPPATLGCFEQASRRGTLERALRTRVGRDEADRLRAKLEDMSG